ncbi:hypothetical protein IE077_004017, partial [Cardiosporidium cionae]
MIIFKLSDSCYRILEDKHAIRKTIDLTTAFEKSRLEDVELQCPIPPKSIQKSIIQQELSRNAHRELILAASDLERGNYNVDKTELSRENKLRIIFDAADEEGSGHLRIRDAYDLVRASGLGLADWDVLLLVQTIQVDEDGLFNHHEWVKEAPTYLEEIKHRRKEYEQRNETDTPDITKEAIRICFSKEFEQTE